MHLPRNLCSMWSPRRNCCSSILWVCCYRWPEVHRSRQPLDLVTVGLCLVSLRLQLTPTSADPSLCRLAVLMALGAFLTFFLIPVTTGKGNTNHSLEDLAYRCQRRHQLRYKTILHESSSGNNRARDSTRESDSSDQDTGGISPRTAVPQTEPGM